MAALESQNVQRSPLLHGIRTLCTYASWDIRLCTYHRKKCIQKVFPSPIKKGKKGQTRPPREAFISATSKSFSQLYLGYCPNVSLLNNAPNYLFGCVIQKRYTSFQDCHVYDKGGFTGASRCNFYATKAWNLNNCENSSSNSTTVSNLMIKSRAGSCTYKWIDFIWSLPLPYYLTSWVFSWNQFHEKFHEVDFT